MKVRLQVTNLEGHHVADEHEFDANPERGWGGQIVTDEQRTAQPPLRFAVRIAPDDEGPQRWWTLLIAWVTPGGDWWLQRYIADGDSPEEAIDKALADLTDAARQPQPARIQSIEIALKSAFTAVRVEPLAVPTYKRSDAGD